MSSDEVLEYLVQKTEETSVGISVSLYFLPFVWIVADVTSTAKPFFLLWI
jgi:hypothetical protein